MTAAPGPAKRDRQRAGVYAWEDTLLADTDRDGTPFTAAQGMVDAIWQESGLRFPPKVERLPRQCRHAADGSRLTVRVPERFPAWVLLHELAHAMTATHDGGCDGHGAEFLGLYIGLLSRYLRLPTAMLIDSARRARLQADMAAIPWCLDRPEDPRQPRAPIRTPGLAVHRQP